MAERIDDAGADAAARHAAGDNRRVDTVFCQESGAWRVEEDRRAGFAKDEIMVGIRGLRFDLGTGIAVIEGIMHRADLPWRHVAFGMIGGVAIGAYRIQNQ